MPTWPDNPRGSPTSLRAHGLARGDSVFALLGRMPELYIAALGTLKAGMVFTPLFSAFGPEPIRTRMEIGAAKVLVTTASLYKRKVAAWREEIADAEAGAGHRRGAARGLRRSRPARWMRHRPSSRRPNRGPRTRR